MRVRELIEQLSKLHPEARVYAFDVDSEDWESVSGLVYDEKTLSVNLYTDDNS